MSSSFVFPPVESCHVVWSDQGFSFIIPNRRNTILSHCGNSRPAQRSLTAVFRSWIHITARWLNQEIIDFHLSRDSRSFVCKTTQPTKDPDVREILLSCMKTALLPKSITMNLLQTSDICGLAKPIGRRASKWRSHLPQTNDEESCKEHFCVCTCPRVHRIIRC